MKMRISGEIKVAQDVVLREVGTTKVANINGLWVEKIGKGEDAKANFYYYDLEVWDSAADFIKNNLKKDDRLVFQGILRQNSWIDKDNPEGKKKSKHVIRVEEFRIIPNVPSTKE